MTLLRPAAILRRIVVSALRSAFAGLGKGPGILRRLVYDSLPASHLVVEDRCGARFVVNTRDRVIGRQMFLTGQYDFWKLEKALALLDAIGHIRPKVLVDVGANIGSIVIPALHRGLFESATAIEPHPENLQLLRANLALNALSTKACLVPAAASTTSGSIIHLAESSQDSGHHHISEVGIPITSVRIDEFVVHPASSLLWLDIEGHEGFALSGATAALAKGAAVVTEFNPRHLRAAGGLELLLERLAGRRIFDLLVDGHTETNFDALLNRYESGETDILAVDPSNESPERGDQ